MEGWGDEGILVNVSTYRGWLVRCFFFIDFGYSEKIFVIILEFRGNLGEKGFLNYLEEFDLLVYFELRWNLCY